MQLRDYLASPGAKTAEQIRFDIGAPNVAQIHQWAARWKGRQPSAAYARKLETSTGGAVTRQELRDDWRDIWPELVGPDHG